MKCSFIKKKEKKVKSGHSRRSESLFTGFPLHESMVEASWETELPVECSTVCSRILRQPLQSIPLYLCYYIFWPRGSWLQGICMFRPFSFVGNFSGLHLFFYHSVCGINWLLELPWDVILGVHPRPPLFPQIWYLWIPLFYLLIISV